MTGLDTNVLVRYLTQDDAEQSRVASAALEEAGQDGDLLYIPDIVLCELVWVLETAYGYSRRELAPVLDRLLRTRQFAFCTKDVLWQALDDYRRGRGDFSDYVLGHRARTDGCGHTLTFDRGLRGSGLFRVL